MQHWFQQSWCNMAGDLNLYKGKIKSPALFLSDTEFKTKID